MVEDLKSGLMVILMKVNIKMDWSMGEVFILGRMEIIIKVIGLMVIYKVKGSMYGLMELNI